MSALLVFRAVVDRKARCMVRIDGQRKQRLSPVSLRSTFRIGISKILWDEKYNE
jgi:hypothetical protein